jgi:hypothetical protein
MALTLNQDPNSTFPFRPANNPIEYLVNSTNSTEPNFKLNTKIYYDVLGANTLLATIKKPIEYGTTKCIVDISNIVRVKEIETYPYFLASGTVSTLTELKLIGVSFQEYYGTTPAVSGSVVSGTTFPIFQGAFRYNNFFDNNWIKYVMILGQNKQFLSSFENFADRSVFDPITTFNTISAATPFKTVRYSESLYLCAVTYQVTGAITMNVALYDSSYTLLDSQRLSTAAVTGEPYRVDWNLKPSGLEANYGFSSGDVAVAKYMAVFMNIPTDFAVSKEFYFEIDDCTNAKYGVTYELQWLNRTGGWDSYIFTGKSKKRTIADKKFLKNDITRRISGTTIVNDSYARRKKQFETDVTEEFTIREGNMSSIDYNGLEDLFTSPNVFWNDSGTWRSVNVLDSTFESKTNKIDRVKDIELVFEVDMDNTLQGW